MATYKEGVNGPFRGKVGTVVSYQWRGTWVMRSVPKITNKKRSLKQLANQQKMAVVQTLLQKVIDYVRKGYHLEGEKRRMSAFNAAMSYNKMNAVKGDYPDFEIDFEKFRFSEGDLEGARNLQLTRFEDRVEFTWDPITEGNGKYNDQAIILLISKEENMMMGELSGAQRNEGKQSVFLNAPGLQDFHFECYFAFISDDRSMISTSSYCGLIE
jgi:hypothetical protein